MVAPNAQLIGIAKYESSDPNRSGSKTLHFLYKANFIEGTGTLSFTVFDNDRSVDTSDLQLNANYRVSYYREHGKSYLHLVDIQRISK